VVRERCSAGTVAGIALRSRWRGGVAAARHAHSLQPRSAVTSVRRYSPPTARIAPSATLTCCRRCSGRRARSSPSAHCVDTGRSNSEHETSIARRGQQTRVSATARARASVRCWTWSYGLTVACSVAWPV
jgi:hypothetical protein